MKETGLKWLDISFEDSVTCKNMAEFVEKYCDQPNFHVKNIFGYVSGKNVADSKHVQTWCIFEPHLTKKQMNNKTLSLKTYRQNPEVTSSDEEENNKKKIPRLSNSKSKGKDTFDMKNAVKCLIAIIGKPENGQEYKAKQKLCKLIPYIEF